MQSNGDQAAIEAVAKAKALEMQKKKAQGVIPQAPPTSNIGRIIAAGIWLAALLSLVAVFYTK